MPNKIDICRELLTKYVHVDQTPRHLISSHWEKWHEEVKVNERCGKIVSMEGAGFGAVSQLNTLAKVFSWGTILLYMIRLQHRAELFKLISVSRDICRQMGISYTYDCFRQMCSLRLIEEFLPSKKKFTCVVIGDGYGFFSCLVKAIFPECRIILVDLGKTLLFQSFHGQRCFPSSKHYLLGADNEWDIDEADFIYSPAERIQDLTHLNVHWAVNIASMQEMNVATVDQYFTFLRTTLVVDNLFYCCNRAEKVMPGGEVSRFYDYPWDPDDDHLVEAFCPWYKFFLSYAKTENGPTFFGVRIPFVKYFDGIHLHRLSRLAVKQCK